MPDYPIFRLVQQSLMMKLERHENTHRDRRPYPYPANQIHDDGSATVNVQVNLANHDPD